MAEPNDMGKIYNISEPLPAHCKGSRFRPVKWSDISNPPDVRTVGWGIEEKQHGRRRYVPRALGMQIHPFATESEAQKVCDRLNEQATRSPA